MRNMTLGMALAVLALAQPGFGQDDDCPTCHSHGTEQVESSAHAHMKMAQALSGDEQPDCGKAGYTDVPTPAQMAVIRKMMATREHRMEHALWHMARSGLNASQKHELAQAYGSIWTKPNETCPVTSTVGGEDFLYMHRSMKNEVSKALIDAHQKCIAGWKEIPGADDPNWKVPGPQATGVKSKDALAMMQNWHHSLRDPAWLKGKSLSTVGQLIEVTIHNNMHMRFAKEPPPFDVQVPLDGNFGPDFRKYDDPSNDYLGDPYSAHVNPVFWKLHGLVDDLIDDWLHANGYDRIAVDCKGDSKCYQWKGTWTGGPVQLATSKDSVPRGAMKSLNPAASLSEKQANELRRKSLRRGLIGVDIPVESDSLPRGVARGAAKSIGAPKLIDPFVKVVQGLCK